MYAPVQVTPAHLFGGGVVSPAGLVSSFEVSSSETVSATPVSVAGVASVVSAPTSPLFWLLPVSPELLLLHAEARTKSTDTEAKRAGRMTKIDSESPLVPGKFAPGCNVCPFGLLGAAI